PTHATEQAGVAGPWFDRLPHFRLEFTPSAGEEIQAEYLIPRDQVVAAITALRELAPEFTEILQICELRSVAADDLWLSTAYGRDTVALHFTFDPEPERVRGLLPLLEEALVPLAARPHWAKWFAMSAAQIEAQYP